MDPLARLNVYQRYVIEEFAEDYRERSMSRRDLLRRALLVTGSVPLTASVLAALGCGSNGYGGGAAPTPAATQPGTAAAAGGGLPGTPPPASGAGVTVAPDDPAIEARNVSFTGRATAGAAAPTVLAYLTKPAGAGPFPAVVVIHENRGLVEHIKDVARRYAKEGFAALAVDLVSRAGGTGPDQPANTAALTRANPDDLVADLLAGVDYLKAQPFAKAAALGVTGFCFGGGYAWELAVASPDMKAAAPYYGTAQRVLDKLGQTRAAVLAVYAGNDTRITSESPQVEERLKAAGKTFEIKVYPGANHAFFNDTGGSYNETAAKDAWQQTLAWFRRYLV